MKQINVVFALILAAISPITCRRRPEGEARPRGPRPFSANYVPAQKVT
jgi:hypothetical protein